MKNKKLLLALIILFSIGVFEFAFSQDTITKKNHFGIYGSMNIYFKNSENTYFNGSTTGGNFYTSPNYTTVEYKTILHNPSIGFFLQLNRCVFDLGLSNFNRDKQTHTTNNIYGVIASNSYKYFSLGCELRFTWLLMNPDKNFITPYLRLAGNYTYVKEAYKSSYEKIVKSNLYSGFFGTGVQKNFKKKICLRLGFSGNFLSEGSGSNNLVELHRKTAIGYLEMGLSYNFK